MTDLLAMADRLRDDIVAARAAWKAAGLVDNDSECTLIDAEMVCEEIIGRFTAGRAAEGWSSYGQ